MGRREKGTMVVRPCRAMQHEPRRRTASKSRRWCVALRGACTRSAVGCRPRSGATDCPGIPYTVEGTGAWPQLDLSVTPVPAWAELGRSFAPATGDCKDAKKHPLSDYPLVVLSHMPTSSTGSPTHDAPWERCGSWLSTVPRHRTDACTRTPLLPCSRPYARLRTKHSRIDSAALYACTA